MESANLSDRSNSQAAALEELASSIEALSSSLKETARSASEAKNMSEKHIRILKAESKP